MRLDLHIHSSHSRDGAASPREILDRCGKLGLDGCSIADHNQIGGSLEAHSIAADHRLLVLRAVEISAAEGHVLAYGIRELIPRGLAVVETVERIHSSGGLAVAAHPVRFPSGIGLELARNAKFDAIEVLNGGSSRRSNEKARRLAEVRRSPVTAGSDAHELHEIGKAYVEVDSVSTEDGLIDLIRRGLTRTGGRSRSTTEGITYSLETTLEWMKGSFRRL